MLISPIERRDLPDGTLEITRRVPPAARVFGWAIEILSILFAVLSVLTGAPADAPLLLVLAGSLVVAGLGEFCRTGVSELRVEPGARRIVGRVRTRFGTVPMSETSVVLAAGTRLAVTRKIVNRHEFYYLMAREPGQRRSVPLFSHPERDGAEQVLEWVSQRLPEPNCTESRTPIKPRPNPTRSPAIFLFRSSGTGCETACMTYPRHQIAPPDRAGTYHVVNRCVRRAYLCGNDKFSDRNFDHR
ncbi:MAG: hypothetical protein LAT56_17875, partial [Wenzhouxiangella sp.]|nr:hypothetical protein [Wenzhouxiangella sp.]